MIEPVSLEVFGPAARSSSLEEIERLIRSNTTNRRIRIQAAAFALSLVATKAVGEAKFHEDTRLVIDEVARAKARIDIAAWHSLEVIEATAAVLLSAQQFLDEQTIGCTEWPTPKEVAEFVQKAARRAAAA